jgi:long-chain acyl-CoA synthetase
VILQRRTSHHPFPFSSFSQLFYQRVDDPQLSQHTFLSYHDDDQSIRRTYTYGEFGEAVATMTTVLRDRLGLNQGDRLATVLFNHDQTVLIYFAAWTLGITIVPINIAETPDKKRYILDHSEASVVFCWNDAYDEIQACIHDLPGLREAVLVSDDLHRCELTQHLSHAKPASPSEEGRLQDEALIIYTSGTTGPPKGVILTIENLLIDADAITQWHGFGQGDGLMCVLPIHHVNGIVVTLVTPFYFRGKAVLNRKFKSGSFWSRVQEEHVVCVSVVPTLLEFLLESGTDYSHDQLTSKITSRFLFAMAMDSRKPPVTPAFCQMIYRQRTTIIG